MKGTSTDCPSTTPREPDIGESGMPEGQENSFILNAGHAPGLRLHRDPAAEKEVPEKTGTGAFADTAGAIS